MRIRYRGGVLCRALLVLLNSSGSLESIHPLIGNPSQGMYKYIEFSTVLVLLSRFTCTVPVTECPLSLRLTPAVLHHITVAWSERPSLVSTCD